MDKMDVKMSSVVKQLMYVLKLFQVTLGSFHSLDMIQGVHLCCGSFGSVIHFLILIKR